MICCNLDINDLLIELKKNDQVFKLVVLYLKVTGNEKDVLLEMYNNSENDFAFETVLSTPRNLELLKLAKSKRG